MSYRIIALAVILTAVGCQNAATQAVTHTEEELNTQEQKRLEIQGIHDAVMPEMSTLNRLARTLKPLLAKDSKLDENEREIVQDVVNRLEKADEGMMNWMGEFHWNLDPLRDSLNHQGIMSYLAAEETTATEVDSQMRNSIVDAQALVVKYKLDKQEGK